MSPEPEEKGGRGTQVTIIVALISLMGALGGALFANWDKVFPPTPDTHNVVPVPPEPKRPEPNPPEPNRPGAFVDRFVGHWVNENPDTSGITRVEIDSRLDRLQVHMWGKCHPTDCDWGTQPANVADSDDGVLSIAWTKDFAVTEQQLRALPDGRLEVSGHTHFTDNSGRPDYDSIHYFVRR